jgi:hypothetical protein
MDIPIKYTRCGVHTASPLDATGRRRGIPRLPKKKEVRDAALTSFFIAICRFDFPAATSCREIAWRFIFMGVTCREPAFWQEHEACQQALLQEVLGYFVA